MPVRLKKSRVPNLFHAENGHYYMRAMVEGKAILKLLRTRDKTKAPVKNFALAKRILLEELEEIGAVSTTVEDTWEKVCSEYLKEYCNRPELSEETKKAKGYEMSFASEAFRGKNIDKITALDISKWWARFCEEKRQDGKDRAARTKNAVLESLLNVLKYAESSGLISHAPRPVIKHIHRPKTIKHLSPLEEFRAVVDEMRVGYKRAVRPKSDDYFCHSADMIEFIAYSGCRHEEARRLMREDIQAHGVIIHGVKRGDDRFIEFNRGLKEVCTRLIRFHAEGNRGEKEPVFQIHSPRKAFERATRAVGAPHCTMHGLRHFFITSCMEAGIVPAVIAKWVGHKDGGVLIAKTYTHVRDDHRKSEADKLNF